MKLNEKSVYLISIGIVLALALGAWAYTIVKPTNMAGKEAYTAPENWQPTNNTQAEQISAQYFGSPKIAFAGTLNPSVYKWNGGKQGGHSSGSFRVYWIQMPSHAGRPGGYVGNVKAYTSITKDKWILFGYFTHWNNKRTAVVLYKLWHHLWWIPVGYKVINGNDGMTYNLYRIHWWAFWEYERVRLNIPSNFEFIGPGIYKVGISINMWHSNPWGGSATPVNEHCTFMSNAFLIK